MGKHAAVLDEYQGRWVRIVSEWVAEVKVHLPPVLIHAARCHACKWPDQRHQLLHLIDHRGLPVGRE